MFVLFADEAVKTFLEAYSSQILMLVICAMVLVAVLVLGPQVLRARQRATDLLHEEQMRALEQGQILPRTDDRSLYAGRTAALVPMVVVCAAGTVTCFLAAYKYENLFSVSLAVWSVAGVVIGVTSTMTSAGRLRRLSAAGSGRG